MMSYSPCQILATQMMKVAWNSSLTSISSRLAGRLVSLTFSSSIGMAPTAHESLFPYATRNISFPSVSHHIRHTYSSLSMSSSSSQLSTFMLKRLIMRQEPGAQTSTSLNSCLQLSLFDLWHLNWQLLTLSFAWQAFCLTAQLWFWTAFFSSTHLLLTAQ